VPPDVSRRGALSGAAAALVSGAAPAAADRFAAIERSVGGRLGVAALDTANGARLMHRAGERFAMCSTFKLLAVAAPLARVDRGREQLDRVVHYGQADLLEYAPVTRAAVGAGGLSMVELCRAAVEVSDNTAANLILKALGGPGAVTHFARTLGDPVTRLDRMEPELNTSLPGDPRDTTTPAAMMADARAVVLGGVLSPASRERLSGWMVACATGRSRLRAGLPADWRTGDKTGTGERGTANDVAVAWAPGGPILIACYLSGATSAQPAARDGAHAAVARAVVAAFRGPAHG
jgi:beta-lactamase class A